MHYTKKMNLFFKFPKQAADGKMYFLVLVTPFAYLFTIGSLTWSCFPFMSYDQILRIVGHNS